MVSGCVADVVTDVDISSLPCSTDVLELDPDVETAPGVGAVGAQGVGPTGHSESTPLKGRGSVVGIGVVPSVPVGTGVGSGLTVDWQAMRINIPNRAMQIPRHWPYPFTISLALPCLRCLTTGYGMIPHDPGNTGGRAEGASSTMRSATGIKASAG
jgi:hypothetical protein